LERGGVRPEVGREFRCQVRGIERGIPDANIARAVDLLGLVGDEEKQPVLDDRTAERGAVLLLARRHLRAVRLFAPGSRAPAVGGVIAEEAAFKLVAARARHRGDRGAADLVVLGLVVRGDDLVLADGKLRERASAAGILATGTALQHIVLL